jgi:hypothetical protein
MIFVFVILAIEERRHSLGSLANALKTSYQSTYVPLWECKFLHLILVCDGARIKYKLMYGMVYFKPVKNKQQSISCIGFPDTGMVVRYVDIKRHNDKAHNYDTYLNSGFLRTPCEYVLHGLVLGFDWAPLWPYPISKHPVATPNPVSCFLLQRFKFHPNVFCYLGGFSLMYK